MEKQYFLLLQINDSQFPIGSYTQSYGLETYVQKGIVKDGESAKAFLQAQLYSSLLYSELLPVKLAYSYSKDKNMDKIKELERLSLVSRSPKELREASLKLGKRFIKTVEGLTVDGSLDFFQNYKDSCQAIGLSHPVAYGVFCGVVGLEESLVLSTYLYSQISGFVTNSVKLVPLSQTEGQQILSSLGQELTNVVEMLKYLGEDDLFLSCPALDIRSMEHEKLYSRLYMS